jgi:hypothetical protein
VLFVYARAGGCSDLAEELGRAHFQDLRGRERKQGRKRKGRTRASVSLPFVMRKFGL